MSTTTNQLPQVEIDLTSFDKANPPATFKNGRPRAFVPKQAGETGPTNAYGRSTTCGSITEANFLSNPDGFHADKLPPTAIVHEKPEHRVMIMLKAQGLSNREIAARMDRTPEGVGLVLNQPWARERLVKEITESGRDCVQELLRGAATDCVQTLISIRDTAEKESDRVAAAKDLLDRFLGKPTQRVESHNTNVAINGKDVLALDKEIQETEAEIARLRGAA